jgi:uncharacterized SAM-binding protein YcdF (DUF218 family)
MTIPHRSRDDTGRSGDSTPVGIIRPIPMGDMASADDLVDFDAPVRRGRRGRPGRTARRRRIPVAVRVVFGLVLAAFVYYGVTLIQVYVTGRSDQAREVDAIVVMGAAQYDGRPSPQLAARLDHVVTLYGEGLAPFVVVTGGKQPEDRFTEAEASRDYLVDRGVPADVILMESEGHTTYQSMEGVADLLHARGLNQVLVVTDPFHSLRSRMIAEDVGLDAYVSPTPTSVVRGAREVRRHLLEAAGVAVGRIIGFDRL